MFFQLGTDAAVKEVKEGDGKEGSLGWGVQAFIFHFKHCFHQPTPQQTRGSVSGSIGVNENF